MYLSATEIAQGRQHTLNNFQTASSACVSASERMAELFVRLGRSQLRSLARQPLDQGAGGQWLAGLQSQSALLLGELLGIISDTQQTVIIAGAAQTRLVDSLLVTTLERARSTSPAEILPALSGLRQSIEQTEQGLNGWTDAALQSVSLLEQQVSQLVQTLQAQDAGGTHPGQPDSGSPAGSTAALQ